MTDPAARPARVDDRTWWRYLAVVVPVALLVPLVGADAQAYVALLLGVACVAAVLVGIRRWRPEPVRPWRALAGCVTLFLVASIVREVELAAWGEHYPSIADPLDASAYVVGIVGMLWFFRVRAEEHGDDRTDRIDVLIVVAGLAVLVWTLVMLPSLTDDLVPATGRVINAAFSVLSLAWFGTVLRLAIGPGRRNASWALLTGTVGLACGADVFDSLAYSSWGAPPGTTVGAAYLRSFAFAFGAAAALHPSMRDLARPGERSVARMGRWRAVLMFVGVAIPPAVLFVQPQEDWGLYAPVALVGWLVVSGLTIVRLTGLVRAQERVADREQSLARLSSDLAGATSTAQVERLAEAGLETLLTEVPGVRVRVLLGDDAEDPPAAAGLAPEAVTGDRAAAVALARALGHVAPVDAVAVAPAAGPSVLVVLSAGVLLAPAHETAAVHLATNVSLAVEAISAVARLQREAGEHRFRALVEHSSDLVAILDGDGQVSFLSPAVRHLLGWDESEALGAQVLHGMHGDDHPRFHGLLRWAAAARRAGPVELRLRHADGGWRWFEAIATDMTSDPLVRGIVLNARDISVRKEAEDRLSASEARFRSLVQHASDVTMVISSGGGVEYVSPSAGTVLGLRPEAGEGREFHELVHPEDRMTYETAVLLLEPAHRSVRRLELRLLTGLGDARTCDVTLTDLRTDPAVRGIVVNAHDVSAQKALEHDLRHLASHDDLTGLANRALFRERVLEALQGARRRARKVGVLFIDVDDFKTVNDSLGHSYGDELLVALSDRLRRGLQASAVPARLGGDEFAVLVTERADLTDLTDLGERLLGLLCEPVDLGDRTVVVHASIGVATNDGLTTDPGVLLRNADAAMYHAKTLGKGRVEVFDESMHLSAIERLELKADLEGALERGELELHYQSIVALPTSAVVGYESLVRWHHPTRGTLKPGSFLGIAEETGAIRTLGRWILRTAVDQLVDWQAHRPGLTMSINLAPRQLGDVDIVDEVASVLASSGLDPASVLLELTEERVIDEEAVARLHELRALGVGLKADDFGTGFASYAALQQMPFTGVKIDRSLVSALGATPETGAGPQVRAIVDMARSMGLDVVAEGVEDERQVAVLREIGCELAQGFHFDHPAPARTVTLRLGGTDAPSRSR